MNRIAHYTLNIVRGIGDDSPVNIDRHSYLNGFVERFSSGLRQNNGLKRRDVVIVTGTTGSLGSYLLDRLVGSDDIHRIYALNRASSDGTPLVKRQMAALAVRGLDAQIAISPKVILLEADFGNSTLGLNEEILQEVRAVRPTDLFVWLM